MLEEGFLASTLFYPTIAHQGEHINQYSVACDRVFRNISEIFVKNISPSSICKGNYCKPSFQRLN